MTSCDRPGANASMASWHWTLCRQGTTQSRVAVCDEDGGHPGLGAGARSEGLPRVRLTSLEMLAPAVTTAIVGAILGESFLVAGPYPRRRWRRECRRHRRLGATRTRSSRRALWDIVRCSRERSDSPSRCTRSTFVGSAGLVATLSSASLRGATGDAAGGSPDTLTACLQSGSALGRRARVQESCSGRTRRHSTDRCRGTSRRCLRRAS